jgi:acyl-CoA reductase-like NAD-dependent aldehyde dehydrogenase
MPVVDEIRYIRRHFHKWMKPRRASVNWQFLPSKARVVYQPLGVVGVIGAWNYPVMLTLSPLANALVAGNRVIVKPSELASATADVIHRMIQQCFANDHVAVVTGGSDPQRRLLHCPLTTSSSRGQHGWALWWRKRRRPT